MKRDLIEIFINETYSSPPKKNYKTNKLIHIHTYEIWSIDLADMFDHKIPKEKGYWYIFIKIDNFSKHTWLISLKKVL